MKKRFMIGSIAALFLIFSSAAFAQVNSPWKWSHPTPQGNTLRYVKVFSNTDWIAAGYAGTFIKTTNGGSSWFITHDAGGVQTTSQYFFYSGWFFDMNTGIVSGSNGKISRTTNGGISWDTIPTGLTNALYGIHFVNSTTGFIGGSTGMVLKTTNGGLNWTQLTTGITTTINNIFALDENRIYAPTTSAVLRYTTDGGTSWTSVTTGTSVTLYDVAFKDANTGIVSGTSTALRVTTNGGANWTATNAGLPSSTLYEIKYVSSALSWYTAGNSFYSFRSTNDGTTWDSVAFTGNQYWTSTYYSIDRNGGTLVTSGAYGLINSSTNSGANWVAHNPLLYVSTLNDIWCDNMNGRVIAVGSISPTPIMYSSNGGANWSTDPGSWITNTLYGIKMVNSTTGYATGSSGRVFKTTNGGANWDSVAYIGATNTVYSADFLDVNTGWVSGSSGLIRKTTNGGATWQVQTTGITNTLYKIDIVDANTGWFIGSSGTVRKTTDGGTTWNAQAANLGTSTIYWIQMLNASTGYLCASSGNVRKTTNGGANWDTVPTPATNTLYSVSFLNANSGFISGSSGVTYRTSDGGANWQIYNTSGSTMNVVYARHYDSAWVCGSSGAILKFSMGPVGVTTWNGEVPLQYTLSQNYPNPFNPMTKIKFGLPKAGRVMLKVYDITGREVSRAFDNMELNAGTVTYEFDGKNLASGVYFYSLFVENNLIGTKKMMLLK